MQEQYYLANGTYATTLSQLDVETSGLKQGYITWPTGGGGTALTDTEKNFYEIYTPGGGNLGATMVNGNNTSFLCNSYNITLARSPNHPNKSMCVDLGCSSGLGKRVCKLMGGKQDTKINHVYWLD